MNDEIFLTDKQLCDRWHCSHMKLFRLRKAKRLPAPMKLNGSEKSRNLTPLSVVRSLEAVASREPVAA